MEALWQNFTQWVVDMAPYWPSVAVFIFAMAFLGHFQELIGIKGIWKFIVAIIITVLYYNYWDSVIVKHFISWLKFMGLEPLDGESW